MYTNSYHINTLLNIKTSFMAIKNSIVLLCDSSVLVRKKCNTTQDLFWVNMKFLADIQLLLKKKFF
jgi:hypothetical protein